MFGLELGDESFEETVPTFEVRGLIKGAQTLGTFDAEGIELSGSLNAAAFDGVTDYAVDELVLMVGSQLWDDVEDVYKPAAELDGVYKITNVGGSPQNPLLERVLTSASLFEIQDGAHYGGTFWKNLTLLSSYVPDQSPFMVEQLDTTPA